MRCLENTVKRFAQDVHIKKVRTSTVGVIDTENHEDVQLKSK